MIAAVRCMTLASPRALATVLAVRSSVHGKHAGEWHCAGVHMIGWIGGAVKPQRWIAYEMARASNVRVTDSTTYQQAPQTHQLPG